MKIILASDSSFLIKYGYSLIDIPKDRIKIGYIMTAQKGTRTDHSEKLKLLIEATGYHFDEIDIEGKSKEELESLFKDKNVIQVAGGNTFYLLKAIRSSGFKEFLNEALGMGKIYIGTSAGSYIMCPSIEVSDWSDDSIDRFGVSDFSALNYVPFVLRVHYKDEMKNFIKENIKELHHPLRILRDGQGILVENDKYTFLGDGDEVKLI